MARNKLSIHVLKHPLAGHMLSELRDGRTRPERFRDLVGQLAQLLAYEACMDLKLEAVRVQTPMEGFEGRRLKLPVTIVPILRAGMGMADGLLRMIPDAQVGHIGMFRDEKSLSPISYYEKLPRSVAAGPVLLVDPMLATGGSAMTAIQLLRNRKCKNVRLLCLIAAPEGVAKVNAECPEVPIHAAALDRELDDRGFILPGLGDAGDRLFGTTG